MMTVGSISVTLDDDGLSIDATLMHEDVDYEDITYVEIRTGVDYGDRVGGLDNYKVLTGNFRNAEFGKYRLAVWNSVNECIIVHTVGKTVVFNLEDDASTIDFYNDLLDRLSEHPLVSSKKPMFYEPYCLT